MDYSVQVEKPSAITRKLTIKVPASTVSNRFQQGLQEVARTAKLKGFRPGKVPLNVIKQYYGEDVKHRVFHNLIDESYREAVRKERIRVVGSPKIETPEHQKGEGAHDHGVEEGQDLTYTAVVEVLPELEVKDYTGIPLKKEKVEVTKDDVQKVLDGLREAQGELNPVAGGLALPDGTQSSRPVQKGDYADIEFKGGMVTESGVEEKQGMSGSRLLEIGSGSLIPGFEEELIGLRKGETKTFRIKFPDDFYEAEMAGEEAEFTVTINELKEKKLPELNDEFAKTMGYEGAEDMRKKAEEHLIRERTEETDRKMRSDLLEALIKRNPFDVPEALIQTQTRALAQEVGGNLKNQGFNDQMIQEALQGELENLKKRAEGQVRSSLLLEAIAKKEKIEVSSEEIDAEMKKMAESMRMEEEKLRDFYAKNPSRKEDLEFRLREDKTLKFLTDQAKVK